MFFKKGISVLLAFILLVSSGGWSLNIHYCGGEIASISAFEKNSNACCDHHVELDTCCALDIEEDEDGCCSDDILQVELEDVVVEYLKTFTLFQAILPDFSVTIFAVEYSSSTIEQLHFYCDSNAPPLYLLYSQWVLYA
jgi:hypothetical protein